MSELLGYAAAIVMGGVLGLMGGGGSILTVPILVYLFGLSPLSATGASLLIVGLANLASLNPGVLAFVASMLGGFVIYEKMLLLKLRKADPSWSRSRGKAAGSGRTPAATAVGQSAG